jgi:hypothetical protein
LYHTKKNKSTISKHFDKIITVANETSYWQETLGKREKSKKKSSRLSFFSAVYLTNPITKSPSSMLPQTYQSTSRSSANPIQNLQTAAPAK